MKDQNGRRSNIYPTSSGSAVDGDSYATPDYMRASPHKAGLANRVRIAHFGLRTWKSSIWKGKKTTYIHAHLCCSPHIELMCSFNVRRILVAAGSIIQDVVDLVGIPEDVHAERLDICFAAHWRHKYLQRMAKMNHPLSPVDWVVFACCAAFR